MTNSSEAVAGLPRLHLVTDARLLRQPGFLELAREALAAGEDRVALHVRGPGLPGREIWRLAMECVRLARRTGAWVLVNDRVDVALASGARGVQLGRASFRPCDVRPLLGADRVIGASVHDFEEATAAVHEGADFLLAGTLFSSPSHPGGETIGLSVVEELSRLGLPVVGIGGIDPSRVGAVRAAGAHGAAAISAIWSSGEPARAVRDFLSILE